MLLFAAGLYALKTTSNKQIKILKVLTTTLFIHRAGKKKKHVKHKLTTFI